MLSPLLDLDGRKIQAEWSAIDRAGDTRFDEILEKERLTRPHAMLILTKLGSEGTALAWILRA
jgi:hypothetical protein